MGSHRRINLTFNISSIIGQSPVFKPRLNPICVLTCSSTKNRFYSIRKNVITLQSEELQQPSGRDKEFSCQD